MDKAIVNVRFKAAVTIILLVFLVNRGSQAAWREEFFTPSWFSKSATTAAVSLDRHRRDVASSAKPAIPVTTPAVLVTKMDKITKNDTEIANVTDALRADGNVSVTQIPLLGVNGSGILKVTPTENTHKVSEPIDPDPDYDMRDISNFTPDKIKAEHNITDLTIDNHEFYNSSFIGNAMFFNEYWANITTKGANAHRLLSNSHRRATMIQLSFTFPFYGYPIKDITVATGGFIHTGEHVHNWLAATQYIAPLMANFDTSLTNDSYVKLKDDGDRFTVLWENVPLQEDLTKKFTFAATLYKNGDIVFAYKNIPIDVNTIKNTSHPVKVGISDAYMTDAFYYQIPKLTIYHRVSFKNHNIKNGTVLWLTALPTCIQFSTCDECLNHDTTFNCTWCSRLQKCSSGTDRNKQSWEIKQCNASALTNATTCPATQSDTANNTVNASTTNKPDNQSTTAADAVDHAKSRVQISVPVQRRPIGGAVFGFVVVALICSLALWVVYAFKNPHTRSGQFLIKYRPSQWSWRRGEARYTAATIHM